MQKPQQILHASCASICHSRRHHHTSLKWYTDVFVVVRCAATVNILHCVCAAIRKEELRLWSVMYWLMWWLCAIQPSVVPAHSLSCSVCSKLFARFVSALDDSPYLRWRPRTRIMCTVHRTHRRQSLINSP